MLGITRLVLFLLLSFSDSFCITTHKLCTTARFAVNPTAKKWGRTKSGKLEKLDKVKNLLERTAMIVAMPIEGVSMEQVDLLRKALPPETIASVVKNTIMRICTNGTEFEKLMEMKGENMYFFIPDAKWKETHATLKKWREDTERSGREFSPKAVVFEHTIHKGIDVAVMLEAPTKQDIALKIIAVMKEVPSRLVYVLKMIPTRLVEAVKLATEKIAASNPQDEVSPTLQSVLDTNKELMSSSAEETKAVDDGGG